jgi:filamentous hemagglutinin family protein
MSVRQVLAAAVASSIGAFAQGGPIASGSPSAPQAAHTVPPCTVAACLAASSLPSGGQVQSGTASITQSGDTTTVRQTSQDVSIAWQSFNIGAQDTVDFLQPSSSAIAINRIGSSNGSQILGSLDGNGQVWLINPNGVLFGRGAQVNVGGLVASTLAVNDPLSWNSTVGGASSSSTSFNFSGAGAGSIENQGTLTAAAGGYVALLGNKVSNQGTISAKLGTVALGAGSATTLTFAGTGLVKMQVNEGTLNALAANGGLIEADGGTVILSAGAKNALLASVVNNTGVIEARTVENHDGTIELLGGMRAGTVTVGGTLDAGAPEGGNGGFIETDAARVQVADEAKVTTLAAAGKAGTWLIDPTDFTIAPSGGDETGAQLGIALTGGNVTIMSSAGASGTSGNINVDDTVSWSANTLTLNAYNNININSTLNGSGSASLALQYGQGASNGVIGGATAAYNVNAPVNLPAGPNFSTKLGSSGSVVNYNVITSLGAPADASTAPATMTLQGMAATTSLSGNYALGSNIDATATANWNGGAGFTPIGNQSTNFTGSFDGLGHTISNLTINLPSTNDVGLFGYAGSGSIVQNVGLVGGSVSGPAHVGALVGFDNGTVSNSYATGSVSGSDSVGGLVGFNFDGTVSNSYATGSVSGSENIGGLVGYIFVGGTVSNCYATGSVTGASDIGGLVGFNSATISSSFATGSVSGSSAASSIGGLVGYNDDATVSNSYATGSVSGSQGSNYVGGLVGYFVGGTVSNSYATGSVSGSIYVGGLVGLNNGTVSNSYATGSVSGSKNIGGLVGYIFVGGTVSNSYATGSVSGSDSVGGLVGFINTGTVSNSFWDTQTTGQMTSAGGGTGLTTPQMHSTSNFSGFNFTSTPGASGNNWVIVDSGGTLNNAGGGAGATFPMLASEYSSTINNAHQLQLMTMNLGASYTLGGNVDASATAGTSTDVWYGSTFIPIGNSGTNFTGIFNGLGHTINNLTITLPSTYGVGLFGYTSPGSVIQNVGLVDGSVSGFNTVGGLVGSNGGTVSNSYATGSVKSSSDLGAGLIGGLVGYNAGSITNSYATDNVSGGSALVGGLVGFNDGTVSNSYATGSVSGSTFVGGLVGENDATISNSYATGTVGGSNSVGGLVGFNNGGSVMNSFWDTTTSGQSSSAGGSPLTDSQMQSAASFTGWSISAFGGSGDVWRIYQGNTYPLLTSFLTPLTLSNTTVTYNGSAQSVTSIGAPISGVFGSAATGTNAGFYNGYYSNQQGYDLTGGTLTINPATLSLSGTRVYDGTTVVAGSVLTATGVAGQSFVVIGAGDPSNLSSKDVQSGSTLSSVAGLALGTSSNGGLASNYTALSTTGSSITITPLALTGASIASASSTYGATVTPGAVSFSNEVPGDGILSTASIVSPLYSTSSNLRAGSYYQTASSLSGPNAGDYTFAGYTTPTANYTVSPLALTAASIAAVSSTYGTREPTGAVTLTGVITNDQVGSSASIASPLYSTSNNLRAGSYDQTATLSGADALDYTFAGGASSFTTPTADYTVSPLALTATSIAAVNSVYGTPKATGGVTLTGVITGDKVSSTASIVKPVDSSSGNLDAGSYAQTASTLAGADALDYTFADGASSFTTPTANYRVSPLALTATSIAAVSAIYGTPEPTGAVTLKGAITGDKVSSTASIVKPVDSNSGNLDAGSYAQTASALAGTDARNYTLSGSYTTPSANYTVGRLTLDVTGVTATNKVYNGSAADPLGGKAAIAPLKGDKVTLSGTGVGAFANANVGTGKAVSVSGYCVTGADAGNYSLWEPTGLSASITQLSSVAWVGGSSGVWSKASNWAGGAIPDYDNVASVSIPSGATVTYDSGVPGATTLSTLTSSGTLLLAAGKLSTSGNLSTAGYEQSGGTLDVGGSLTIRSPSGGVTLGDISAGSLSVSSQAGAITQLASTAIDVKGGSSLTADNGVSGKGAVDYAVTLAQTADKLQGAVTAQGSAITLDDATALTATLDSTGAVTLDAAGALVVAGTVGTSLTTVTTGGADSTTTFDATSVGSSLKVTSTGAVTTATTSTVLTVDGEGTKTPNSHVTVNGVTGAEIK